MAFATRLFAMLCLILGLLVFVLSVEQVAGIKDEIVRREPT